MIEYRPGGRSFFAALFRLLVWLFVKPIVRWWPLRGPLARLMPIPDLVASLLPRHRSTEFVRIEGGTWCAEYVKPRGAQPAHAALLFLHGGAFVTCGLGTHRRI